MPVVTRIIKDRAEWLEWRKPNVNASNGVPALFNCHPDPKQTELRLYAEKRGTEFSESPDSKAARRGRKLEPSVAEDVAEQRPEWKLTRATFYNFDPDLRLGCTPDYMIHNDGQIGCLQIKTTRADIYARDWVDGPPFWIILQNATEVMLCDADFGAIAVMVVDPFDDFPTHIYDVPRNRDVEAKIRNRVAEFWKNVESGIEPQPDFNRDREVIKALRPQETKGRTADLSGHNELPDMLARRAMLKKQIDLAEHACDAIETEVMFLLGDAEAATGLDGWTLTYKTQDRKAYNVPAKRMRVLRIYDRREKETSEL